jgi:acetate kinase
MTRAVACLNAGSSSIKFALFKVAGGEPVAEARGKIEGIGTAPHLIIKDKAGRTAVERRWAEGATLSHETLLGDLLDWMRDHLADHEVIGIGHRVVHGGTRFSRPEIIDDTLLDALDGLTPLAPLHQPHNLAAIRAVRAILPGLPQVACFDTAFHASLAPVATRLALPRELHDEGIRRYGFHGLSYEYVSRVLAEVDPGLAAGKVIAAHLGNGASLCAIRNSASVDTSMGFTALDGLVMGTRCGTLDPGVILYLLEQKGMSAGEIADLLYNRSGLLGVSGLSGDVRVLLDSGSPHARDALELFAWRAAREAGALISTLGGLDGIVFTAGIGENAPEVRSMICERLGWIGVSLDEAANRANAAVISGRSSRVTVRVIPTDEERMIAIHTLDTLSGPPKPA